MLIAVFSRTINMHKMEYKMGISGGKKWSIKWEYYGEID